MADIILTYNRFLKVYTYLKYKALPKTQKKVSSTMMNEVEEELFEHHRVVADKGQEPLRVDKFLLNRLEGTSRNKIQQAAIDGYIHVNDKAVKSNYKVKPHDVVTVMFKNPPREIELIPQDIPLDIIYEDDDIVILNKEAGMVVHPGYGNYSGYFGKCFSLSF